MRSRPLSVRIPAGAGIEHEVAYLVQPIVRQAGGSPIASADPRRRMLMKLAVRRQPIVVPGFRFAGVACGLKASGKRDVALIVSDRPAVAAAAFTTNRVKAAPVIVGQERLRGGRVQAVLVNSGNANACTGARRRAPGAELTGVVAERLGIAERRCCRRRPAASACSCRALACAAGSARRWRRWPGGLLPTPWKAIMTTDAFPKIGVGGSRLGGRDVTHRGDGQGRGHDRARHGDAAGVRPHRRAGHARRPAQGVAAPACRSPSTPSSSTAT